MPERSRQHRITWVLVADEAIAHLYERPADGGELQPVEQLTDPSAHDTVSEQRRDAAGRRGSTATVSAGEEKEDLASARFARDVAARLAERLREKRFDELVVAAAPRFLGQLRRAFDKPLAASVTQSIDKDLIHETAAELTARLFPARAG